MSCPRRICAVLRAPHYPVGAWQHGHQHVSESLTHTVSVRRSGHLPLCAGGRVNWILTLLDELEVLGAQVGAHLHLEPAHSTRIAT